jgi:hypothetical protein
MSAAKTRPVVEFVQDPRMVRGALMLFAVLFALTMASVHLMAQNAWELGVVARKSAENMSVDEVEHYREQAGRLGVPLAMLNVPVMVYLGVQARGDAQTLGPGYYIALMLGSTYIPALFTFGLFFLREMLNERHRLLAQRSR